LFLFLESLPVVPAVCVAEKHQNPDSKSGALSVAVEDPNPDQDVEYFSPTNSEHYHTPVDEDDEKEGKLRHG